jgi:hypothetical protein
LGTATLSGGVAVLTKTTLPAGILSITKTYNGGFLEGYFGPIQTDSQESPLDTLDHVVAESFC